MLYCFIYLWFLKSSFTAPEPPPSKPKFTTRLPPQNQLPQGESLILKTKVEGYPIPKITWYKDGVTLKNEPGSEISFKNGEACLRVPQTKEDDGGVYSCVASNPSGQDTTNCNVSCSRKCWMNVKCRLDNVGSFDLWKKKKFERMETNTKACEYW